MNIVIGSGPAGVAAAAALIDRGLSVTMLDAGGELEPEIVARVANLARSQPEGWTPAEREAVSGPLRYNSEGAPLKLAFGSDYVYRDVEALQPVTADGVDAYRALSAGGLSVLWGAAVLPYSEQDFTGWPLGSTDMAPHYSSALEMMGLAAEHDGLSKLYPLHARPGAPLEASRQARFLLERMTQHEAELQRQGIHYGRARLAIRPPDAQTGSCVRCGMCLYGCPYGLIYSTQHTLQTRLAASKHFTYLPGYLVRSLRETSGAVTIHAVSRQTLQPRQFEASRVYLAAGVLASTAILLESLQAYAHPIVLKQSDHFLLPLLLRRSSGHVTRERLHTLSQVFIEILDREVTRHGVHLQVYTYNDHYLRMAKDRLGPLFPLAAPLVAPAIDRIVIIKGYLHSAESAGIRATMDRSAGGAALRLDAVSSPTSRSVIRAVTTLLSRNARRIGASPLRLGLRIGRPGSGVHVGGSFPMQARPARFDTDVMGRPPEFARVHVVDTTVFPTLPAAPPTLTIMANAHRIASGSQQEAGATA